MRYYYPFSVEESEMYTKAVQKLRDNNVTPFTFIDETKAYAVSIGNFIYKVIEHNGRALGLKFSEFKTSCFDFYYN